jgi:UDP-N-acetylglucosamine acyltransferase
MATEIHPTAIVHAGAELDENVVVGPFSIVGPEVKVGSGTRLRSHVVVDGRTELGRDCDIYPHTILGAAPQDLKYKGEPTRLLVGDRNVIRECVSIHRGSVSAAGVTTIGNDNFLMGYVHVAHDCTLGSNIIMTNYSALSGHVAIEDYVVLGGKAGVRQFTRIGAFTMVGGMSRISQNVPPFVIVAGIEKPRLFGLNLVGLRRRGFTKKEIAELKTAFSILFQQKLTREEAMRTAEEKFPHNGRVRYLVEFVRQSKGLVSRTGGDELTFSL